MFLIQFFFITSLCRLITDTNTTIQLMSMRKPLVIFGYDDLPTINIESPKRIFNRVSEIYPTIDFGYLNCLNATKKCIDNGINPYPSIHLFGSPIHMHPLEFTNEISLYALCSFITRFTRIQPTINLSTHKVLTANTFQSIIHQNKCSVVFFTDKTDRMSVVLMPTVDQISGSFIPHDNVSVSEVECDHDINFCIDLNISQVPSIRIYKNIDSQNQAYSDYPGALREYPYILDFVNTECGTYRASEADVNISLYLDSCSYSLFKENDKTKYDYQTFIKKAKACGIGSLINEIASKIKENEISQKLEYINQLLHNISNDQTPSKDKLIVYKYILEHIDANNNQINDQEL